jgi:DNA-binding MarR family transcriptional regulator
MTSFSDMPPAAAPSHAGRDLGLVDALAQLSFLVQDALAEIAGEHDLSIIGIRLLGVLRDREPTMNALGRHLGLDKSSISGLVSRAERRGLVTRTVSAADRRAFQVSITDAGQQLVERCAAMFSKRIETLAGGLSDSDSQLLSQLAARIVMAADAHRYEDGSWLSFRAVVKGAGAGSWLGGDLVPARPARE